MKNFVQEDEVVELTAPVGGVVSGGAYQIGQLFVVAVASAPAGSKFSALTEGVTNLPKATGSAWAEGSLLYWDSTANNLTITATGNLLVGVAVSPAASAAATGRVRLNGVARPQEP